jgi:hypothetical protein
MSDNDEDAEYEYDSYDEDVSEGKSVEKSKVSNEQFQHFCFQTLIFVKYCFSVQGRKENSKPSHQVCNHQQYDRSYFNMLRVQEIVTSIFVVGYRCLFRRKF